MSDLPPPKRRFWQIHLSTAVVMMIVSGALLPTLTPYLQKDTIDMGLPDGVSWEMSGLLSDFKSSEAANHPGIGFSIAKRLDGFCMESDFVALDIKGKSIANFFVQGGDLTPFFVDNEVLYWADYCPISSGCTIQAYDLATHQIRWKKGLIGIGPTFHSEYSNSVSIAHQDSSIVVLGTESNGRYIEVLDCKTGTTLGHQRFGVRVRIEDPRSSGLGIDLLLICAAAFGSGIISELLIRRKAKA
jgi:hypothetical protein